MTHDCTTVTAGEAALLGPGAVALRYQRMGCRVLALRAGSKIPHPLFTHGVLWATADERMPPWLWGQDKMAGVAVATDEFAVIDLDTRGGKNGWAEFETMRDAWGLPMPDYPLVSTPSGGLHLWLRLEPGVTIPTRSGILPGVDLKSAGGYVVVPPSRIWTDSMDGHQVLLPYRWVRGCPCSVPLAPSWIYDWARSAPSAGMPADHNGEPVDDEAMAREGLPVGARNINLHRLACSLFRRYGTTPAGVEAARARISDVLARTNCNGFGRDEQERTIRSALRFVQEREREDWLAMEDWRG